MLGDTVEKWLASNDDQLRFLRLLSCSKRNVTTVRLRDRLRFIDGVTPF
ncbi:hypothetical protein QP185_12240 [Sphingomonas aerolata]